MKRWLSFVLAAGVLYALHEGVHVAMAEYYGEFAAIQGFPLVQVLYRTPVEARQGLQWAWISGGSSLVTLLLGYGLLVLSRPLSRGSKGFWRSFWFDLTLLGLWTDALNLSLGPFIYGGDAHGVARGLGVPLLLVQGFFWMVFLINREVTVRVLLPRYGVPTRHPFLRPLALPLSRKQPPSAERH